MTQVVIIVGYGLVFALVCTAVVVGMRVGYLFIRDNTERYGA